MGDESDGHTQARLHLEVLGRECAIEAPMALGTTRVEALVPLARAVVQAVSDVAVEVAAESGKTVRCGPGCGACCRQVVPVSAVEAVALARYVAGLPAERRQVVEARFRAAVARLEELRLLGPPSASHGRHALQSPAGRLAAWDDASRRYFQARIPCPFLEDESCSIHAERPLVCREYNAVTDPAWCSELSSRVETTARPLDVSEALGRAASELVGEPLPNLPLVLSLEWAEHHGHLLDRPVEGEAAFEAFVSHLQALDEGDEP